MRPLAEKQICRVLLQVWDPIGVKDEPNAQDEYDSYAPRIYHLLKRGASDEELAAELHHITTVTMGLSGPCLADMMATVIALRNVVL
jgi:hypothetical protein